MNVSDLMTQSVQSCTIEDDLQRAAQLMWENDCGAVPVVDGNGRVVGMLTDRDICMAAYTQGRPLWQIPVPSAMADQVYSAREEDPVDAVEAMMRNARVRRLPVVDADGKLRGIVSMNDLARHARRAGRRKMDGLSGDSIAQTLAAICEPSSAVKARERASSGNHDLGCA